MDMGRNVYMIGTGTGTGFSLCGVEINTLDGIAWWEFFYVRLFVCFFFALFSVAFWVGGCVISDG